MKKEYVDGHGDVRCFVDDEEVDCELLSQQKAEKDLEEYVEMMTTGGSAET